LQFRYRGSRRESAVAQLSTLGGITFMKSSRIFAILLLACCSGCGTIVQHASPMDYPPVYSGVRQDSAWITNAQGTQSAGARPFIILGSIIDFPLSAILDTLLLPLDIANGGPSSSNHS
jgi:uncharacterized protein YceK